MSHAHAEAKRDHLGYSTDCGLYVARERYGTRTEPRIVTTRPGDAVDCPGCLAVAAGGRAVSFEASVVVDRDTSLTAYFTVTAVVMPDEDAPVLDSVVFVEPSRAELERHYGERVIEQLAHDAVQTAHEDSNAGRVEAARQQFERDEERAALAAIAGGAF